MTTVSRVGPRLRHLPAPRRGHPSPRPRLHLRTGFLTAHTAEIRTLRTKLLPALRAAEHRYDVPLVFPEP
ncbi:hypothetical protein OG601_11310 [Streptomyces sp. NBC_01239]|uniref:hypothetical protein n=1 Tax=Streptomyces sp. NBC_01239 TaxID=2903792 RepID=UPI002252343A|nr:hypothetical protein [Streptomyces sp. NBC_01239]MCX4811209.1 hypothetical protein [Streptomyces sp. NBC_01239]